MGVSGLGRQSTIDGNRLPSDESGTITQKKQKDWANIVSST
jgi:hypothetical protein